MLPNLFKWKHFESEIIILCVRWYLKYPLSYRMLVEMMAERGLLITHTTIMRWVHQYAPVLEKKLRKHLKPTNDSWRVDETYIKVKGEWKYLYRAVDSQGKTVDKNAAYPPAIDDIKTDGKLPNKVKVRQIKYLNNIIEQDHRFIKRIVNPMLGFQSFHTASKTIKGIEAMHMVRKGQVEGLSRCVLYEVALINKLLGIAA